MDDGILTKQWVTAIWQKNQPINIKTVRKRCSRRLVFVLSGKSFTKKHRGMYAIPR
jgi:hypothetical protein